MCIYENDVFKVYEYYSSVLLLSNVTTILRKDKQISYKQKKMYKNPFIILAIIFRKVKYNNLFLAQQYKINLNFHFYQKMLSVFLQINNKIKDI